MAKAKQHLRPTEATQKYILAASGNKCAYPSCSEKIFDLEHKTLVGDRSASWGGVATGGG